MARSNMPAVRYAGRRVVHLLLVLIGVSVLTFVLAEAAPGSFIDDLRLDPRISRATIDALRDRYGLDRSLPQKYLHWLQSVGRGELGFSVTYDSAVGPLLWPRVRNTLILTIPATLLAWAIAIPAGVLAARWRGRWPDRVSAGATTLLLGIPELLIALCLLLVAVRTGYFPTGGIVSVGYEQLDAWDKLRDAAAHFVLPIAGLTLATLPVLVRHVRASVIDILQTPFVQAARAQGIPDRRLLFKYVLRAAANPLISLFGLSIAGLLSASLVIETIMSWPGLGPLLLEAVAARDLHLVVGAVTCSTLLLVCGNIVADVLLYVVDPRMRPERS